MLGVPSAETSVCVAFGEGSEFLMLLLFFELLVAFLIVLGTFRDYGGGQVLKHRCA